MCGWRRRAREGRRGTRRPGSTLRRGGTPGNSPWRASTPSWRRTTTPTRRTGRGAPPRHRGRQLLLRVHAVPGAPAGERARAAHVQLYVNVPVELARARNERRAANEIVPRVAFDRMANAFEPRPSKRTIEHPTVRTDDDASNTNTRVRSDDDDDVDHDAQHAWGSCGTRGARRRVCQSPRRNAKL